MKFLISSQLSSNRYKTPEGYLVCTDCILARTGSQEYRSNELWNDGDDSIVKINRPSNEVFNEKTLASFENKPFVNEHPEEDVNPSNYAELAKGFVRDIKRAVVDGEEVMVGNIIVTDPTTIEQIENHEKEELSCGYDCDIVKDDNGQYNQVNIKGNHIALCEAGRAGIARIKDSKVKDDNIFYGGIKESDLRKSKDFKIKEYLEELDEYRKDKNPKKEFYVRTARDINNDINKRLKQIEHLPNDIFDSRIGDVLPVVWSKENFKVCSTGDSFLITYKDILVYEVDTLQQAKNTVNYALSNLDKFKQKFNIKDSNDTFDSINDIKHKYLSEKAKKLKEELGLYKKQIESHKSKNIRPYTPRNNQYNNATVDELNESINEAIENLSENNYNENAWNRLALHLSAWEGSPELKTICNKAKHAINVFRKYIEEKNTNKNLNDKKTYIYNNKNYNVVVNDSTSFADIYYKNCFITSVNTIDDAKKFIKKRGH